MEVHCLWLAKMTHTQTHVCTKCIPVCSWLWKHMQLPPSPHTHTHTLQHPPKEETTPVLPVALMQRSQVPRRSPASFVLTAGRKPSLAWGHRALGTKRELDCVCVCGTFGVVGVCRGFVQWGHLHSLAGIFPPNSPVHELCREGETRRKLQ